MNVLSVGFAARTGALAAASTLALGALSMTGAGSAEVRQGSASEPALPSSVVVKDARGDMLGHGADIVRVRVTNKGFVRVRIKHEDLVRSFRSGSSGTVYLDTDRSKAGPEFAFVAGLYEGTDYALVKTAGWKVLYDRPVSGFYEMSLDYVNDVTRIRLSRRALDRPGAVRVAVHTAGDLDNHTVDDWLKAPRHLTRWVARG